MLENLTRGKVTTRNSARARSSAVQERILNPLSLRLFEGDLSGLGSRERNLSRAKRDKGRRPSERARASQFKPGDRIKVSAKDGELVFQKK